MTESSDSWVPISLPIFNGKNYDHWYVKMKTFFQSQDLWDIVEFGIKVPKDISGLSKAKKKELQDNKQNDWKALFILQQALAENIFPRIIEATSAKQAWVILQELFQNNQQERSTSEINRATVASERSSEQNVEIVVAPSEQLAASEKKIRHLKLYRAALSGDWNIAEGIFNRYKDEETAPLSKQGDTALHIAAAAESSMFAKKLVEKLKKEDLAKKNKDENTAFCLAAASGKVELVRQMQEKNGELATIQGSHRMSPIHMAALLGRKEMVEYLYGVTKDKLDDKARIQLLVTLISTGLYDVALDLVRKHEQLAIARDEKDETALHALARMPMMSSNFADQKHRGILLRFFNLFSGTKKFRDEELTVPVELVKCLWGRVIKLEDSQISAIIGRPWRLIFVAAEQGNVEFLTILIREYPDLIFKADGNRNTIFHCAVKNRQEEIFKLIYKIGSFKDLIVPYKDKEGNNILHLAGMLAPPNRLNIVSGAALQLQRELLWFKEVSKIVHPLDAEVKNEEGKTPRALFIEHHRELKEKGEKWMKDTANYCMIVATLIATVVFAAAFTVPGGTIDVTGSPHFLQQTSFKIFVVSDAVSLVSSSCSVLTFLSILTSRYAEEDFLLVLPRKLVAGLATLFLSIVAMMVVFCATIFIVFKDGVLWVPILVAVIASIPALLFTKQHLLLFFDVVRSTFISSSLFQPSKQPLFYEKEERATKNK